MMQAVVEMPTFLRSAEAIFSAEERAAVVDYLAAHPLTGAEIPGAGGVRKVRFGVGGKGKRGGARVIYYWYSENAPIYAILVYTKNERSDLAEADKRAFAAMAKAIKDKERKR